MKIKVLIFLTALSFAKVYSKSSNTSINDIAYAKCIYRIVFQPDSTDSGSIRSENTLLLVGKKFSVFKSIGKIKMDSMINNHTFNTNSAINASTFPKSYFWEMIYKNIPQTDITTIERIATREYAYTQDMKSFKWKISINKQKIHGYNCQQATTSYAGRIWEAWYTTELPISDGPYKFTGLPGLIIKIQDTKKYYTFELTNISLKESIPIQFNDSKIPYTTREEFKKRLNNFYENYVDITIAQGGSVYGDPETARKRVAENNKKRNNPLELK